MESPLNQGPGRAQLTTMPSTPVSNSAYRPNVNRKKTKKWVEAKVQSYDGDDWGADELDDDEPEPEPVQSPPNPEMSTHAIGRGDSSLPSLRTHTPTAEQVSSEKQNVEASIGGFAPSPSTLPSGSSQRPSDHENSAIPGDARQSTEAVSINSPMKPSLDGPFETEGGRKQVQARAYMAQGESTSAPLPAILHHATESQGMDKSDGVDIAAQTASTIGTEDRVSDGDGHTGSDGRQPPSSSPKLPDLVRMSAFGSDLFSSSAAQGSTAKHSSNSGLVPASLATGTTTSAESRDVSLFPAGRATVSSHVQDGNDPEKAESDGHIAKATPLAAPAPKRLASIGETANADDQMPTPVAAAASNNLLRKDNIPVLRPDPDVHEIAPLRTPSPRGPARTAPDTLELVAGTHATGKHHGGFRGEDESTIAPAQGHSIYGTITSTTAKDNDSLSDEILKSLSPHSATDTFDSTQHSGTNRLSDSVATEPDRQEPHISDSRADVESVPEVAGQEDSVLSHPTAGFVDGAIDSLRSTQSTTIRRQFSWEGEENKEHSRSTRAATAPSTAAETAQEELLRSPAIDGQPPADALQQLEAISSAAMSVSPRASSGSGQLPAKRRTVLEAPSPLSPDSDREVAVPTDFNRRSGGGDEAMEQSSPGPVLPAPPPETDRDVMDNDVESPPLPPTPTMSGASPPSAMQIMSFREIMNLGRPNQRITKYNEARSILIATDSGLDKWLLELRAQHPEVINGASPKVALASSNTASQSGKRSSFVQQPYYQQYLGASSPNTSGPPASRSRLAGIPVPSQMSGSTFNHSSNQIGTKSKELMHSAGKMGKGLLSKGRNKLRGTGDKDEAEAYASSHEASAKTGRRTSWGWSLGLKSREADAPQKNPTQRAHLTMAPELPQIPSAAPLTPLDVVAHPKPTAEWRHPAMDDASAQSVVTRRQAESSVPSRPSRAIAGLKRLEIPRESSPPSTEANSAPPLSLTQAQPLDHDVRAARTSIDESAERDWALIPRDKAHIVQPQEAGKECTPILEVPKSPLPDEVSPDPNASLVRADPGQDGLQRSSSFVGLPPIRRASTFALTSKPRVRKAANSLTVDGVEGSASESAVVTAPSLQKSDHPEHEPPDQRGNLAVSIAKPYTNGSTVAAPSTEHEGRDLTGLHDEAASEDPTSESRQPSRTVIADESSEASHSTTTILHHGGQDQSSMSTAQVIQHPAIPGPWRLEESKLSRPLNPVWRNKTGATSPPKQPVPALGSATIVEASEPSAQQSSQRMPGSTVPAPPHHMSHAPPSSAQRWPALLAHALDSSTTSRSQQAPQPYKAPYLADDVGSDSTIPMIPAREPNAPELSTSAEGQGRGNKSSVTPQGLGQLTPGVLSRDPEVFSRRREAASDVREDADSDSGSSATNGSDTQERKGQRPSFLFGHSRRAAMDQRKKDHEDYDHSQATRAVIPSMVHAHAEVHNTSAGSIDRGRPGSSGVARALESTPDFSAHDTASVASTTQGSTDATAIKKKGFPRTNDILKLLNRRRNNVGNEFESRARKLVQRPAPPFKYFGRSSTASSVETGSQGRVSEDHPQRRGWRPSVAGLLTGTLGKAKASKMRFGGDSSTAQPPVEQQPHVEQQAQESDSQQPLLQHDTQHTVPRALVSTTQQQLSATAVAQRNDLGPAARDVTDLYRKPLQSYQPHPSHPDGRMSRHVLTSGLHHLADYPQGDELDARLINKQGGAKHDLVHGPISHVPPSNAAKLKPESRQRDRKDRQLQDEGAESPAMSIKSFIGPERKSPSPHGKMNMSEVALRPAGEHTGRPSMDVPEDSSLAEARLQRAAASSNAGPKSARSANAQPLLVQAGSFKGPTAQGLSDHHVKPTFEPTGDSLGDGATRHLLLHANSKHDHGEFSRHGMQSPGQLYPSQTFHRGFLKEPEAHSRPAQYSSPYPQPSGLSNRHLMQHGTAQSLSQPQMVEVSPQYQQHNQESAKFRWKGLTKRMSEHMTNFAQTNDQEAQAGHPDEGSGSRFMNTFKKHSRQVQGLSPVHVHVGVADQAEFLQKIVPRQPSSSDQQLGAQRMQTRQEAQEERGFPAVAEAAPLVSLHFTSDPDQPIAGTHDLHMKRPEPRYDSVPIPGSYDAVHGEGFVAATAYSMGRRSLQPLRPLPSAQPTNVEQSSPTPSQLQEKPEKHENNSPATQATFPPPETKSSSGDAVSSSASSMELKNKKIEVGRPVRKAVSNASREREGKSSLVGVVSNVQGPDSLRPRVAFPRWDGTANNASIESREASGIKSSLEQFGIPVSTKTFGPEVMANGVNLAQNTPRSSNLGIDLAQTKTLDEEDDIYDATPPLDRQNAGEYELARTSPEGSESKKTKSTVPAAELEDTAHAHKRRVRLQSQEEKIWCDPEDDPNYQPPMAATSYPGQEWNPYGDGDAVDWKED